MNPLNSVKGTIVAGFVLAIVILLALGDNHMPAAMPVNAVMIWLHVFAGIIWIGLLYSFNFVQVPALADNVFAGRCQSHMPCRAMQQLDAQHVLQIGDVATDG